MFGCSSRTMPASADVARSTDSPLASRHAAYCAAGSCASTSAEPEVSMTERVSDSSTA